MELKSNHIPKGLVPLERLFDSNDVYKKASKNTRNEDTVDFNIGTNLNSKIVKISKKLAEEERLNYVQLLKEYVDIFAWSYEDLKTYDKIIIKNKIRLQEKTNSVRQKLRPINPMLLPIIENEIRKLWKAKIIIPLIFSDWVANIVPVRKKNGEIRICVDFRNLNKCSLKDKYPLPKMDHLLQKVEGSNRISMIDGYLGYNQIAVNKDDQLKTTFTTPWDTFMYGNIPFGLMNVGATFQWAMDIAFEGERHRFVVVYIFSKSDKEHLIHLRQEFDKCRKFGVSLNPKKTMFAMEEGRLLGHIVTS